VAHGGEEDHDKWLSSVSA